MIKALNTPLARKACRIFNYEGDVLAEAYMKLNPEYSFMEARKALAWDASRAPERFMELLPKLRETGPFGEVFEIEVAQ